MSTESSAARKLAAAIDYYESLTLFNDMSAQHDSTLRVTWQRGSSTGGYDSMSKAISNQVAQRWEEMRQEALQSALRSVEEARMELRNALSQDPKHSP